MFPRSLKTTIAYELYRRRHADSTICSLCDAQQHHSDRSTYVDAGNFVVMTNNFPYRRWDGREVSEHLMFIPKRHVLRLDELTDDERTELAQLMSNYEASGYSIYLRSAKNTSRTVGHVHGHFFK